MGEDESTDSEVPSAVEAGYVEPPIQSSARGPWDLFAREPPFYSLIERIRHRRQYRDDKEHAAYMRALQDTQGYSDAVVYDRCEVILQDIRGSRVPRWIVLYRQKRAAFINWCRDLRERRWPAIRKNIGFWLTEMNA